MGGWTQCVVLCPEYIDVPWHLVWGTEVEHNVSCIRTELYGMVRARIGPHDTVFTGVDSTGEQVPLEQVTVYRMTAHEDVYGCIPLV